MIAFLAAFRWASRSLNSLFSSARRFLTTCTVSSVQARESASCTFASVAALMLCRRSTMTGSCCTTINPLVVISVSIVSSLLLDPADTGQCVLRLRRVAGVQVLRETVQVDQDPPTSPNAAHCPRRDQLADAAHGEARSIRRLLHRAHVRKVNIVAHSLLLSAYKERQLYIWLPLTSFFSSFPYCKNASDVLQYGCVW